MEFRGLFPSSALRSGSDSSGPQWPSPDAVPFSPEPLSGSVDAVLRSNGEDWLFEVVGSRLASARSIIHRESTAIGAIGRSETLDGKRHERR